MQRLLLNNVSILSKMNYFIVFKMVYLLNLSMAIEIYYKIVPLSC